MERRLAALTYRQLWRDTEGSAVVEAAILFPVILMIFTGLCLLAVYLPTRANLQRATQFAADVLATESSDAWIRYNPNEMEYKWLHSHKETGMRNVYLTLFSGLVMNAQSEATTVQTIVTKMEEKGIFHAPGDLKVEYKVSNFVLYKELHVTATRTIKPPVNLSFVGFPTEIPITVTSSSVVLNGDEFVRDVDLVKDLTEYLVEKYNLQDIVDSLNTLGDKFNNAFGVGVG